MSDGKTVVGSFFDTPDGKYEEILGPRFYIHNNNTGKISKV